MIEAARTLFLERGYDAVTLGEIVRMSGGSLSTLYELFQNKAGLLDAIVAEERFEGLERLDAIVARGESPAATLLAIAASIHHDLMQCHVIGLMRIVMAESLRDPAFARSIYENAHLPRLAWLADLFGGWAARGQARIADPMLAAQFFFGLVLHGAQTRALFGALADADSSDDQCLGEAVNLFVAGYAITSGAAA
jgi:TetR/AcrR family transcriptional repressor of mexJK operon